MSPETGVVDPRPEGREAQGVERARELAGRTTARSPAEVGGHRLEGEGDMAPRPRPARASASRPKAITSKASALSAGPASMRWTRPSWSAASRRRTSSPPPAVWVGPERQRPFRRDRSRDGRRLASGRRLGCRGGRLACLGPREAALDERAEGGILRRGRLQRTIHRPTGVGNRVATRRAETARDGRASARPRSPSRSGNRETTRSTPRAPPPTFNPQVVGSSPTRPIADIETGLTVIESKKDLSFGNVRPDAIDQWAMSATARRNLASASRASSPTANRPRDG